MIERLKFSDVASAVVERGRALCTRAVLLFMALVITMSGITIGGTYHVQCFDQHGSLRWTAKAKNGVTNVGINSLLNVYLQAQTQLTTWYIGLIDNAGYTALAAGDTMASHGGWSEVSTSNVSQSARPAWGPGAASSQSMVNASTVNFAMINGGSLTVKGLFLVSDSTNGGTAGTLFSTAAFTGGTQSVNNGDTLKVTYTISAASN